MGKVTTYFGIISMVILGFHFAGLTINTPISSLFNLLNALLNPYLFQDFSLAQQLSLALGGIVLAGTVITIGAIAPQRIQWIVVTTFVLVVVVIGWELIGIWLYLQNTNVMLATLLISPLLFMYVLATMEWWRGMN